MCTQLPEAEFVVMSVLLVCLFGSGVFHEIVDRVYSALMDAVAAVTGGDNGGLWERWTYRQMEKGEK